MSNDSIGLVKGKRYRVVVEGIAESENILVINDSCWLYSNTLGAAKEVTMMEDPLVQFGPGDKIRHKSYTGNAYLIVRNRQGGLRLLNVATNELTADNDQWIRTYCTSEFYEKVN